MRLTTAERDVQQFATRVAWYYYKTGLTQSEIAKQLGLNRARVINILNEARNSGFVSIHVAGRTPACWDWKTRFGNVGDCAR